MKFSVGDRVKLSEEFVSRNIFQDTIEAERARRFIVEGYESLVPGSSKILIVKVRLVSDPARVEYYDEKFLEKVDKE